MCEMLRAFILVSFFKLDGFRKVVSCFSSSIYCFVCSLVFYISFSDVFNSSIWKVSRISCISYGNEAISFSCGVPSWLFLPIKLPIRRQITLHLKQMDGMGHPSSSSSFLASYFNVALYLQS